MDSNDQLLIAKIKDAAELCNSRNVPKFIGFLNAHELSVAKTCISSYKHCIFGGFEFAERVMLCFLPDWADETDVDFPIVPITLSYRERDELSHRDFLGTFMSFGITRDKIGDILIEKGRAVAFIHKDIINYVTTQLEKVGGVGVKLKIGFDDPLPYSSSFENIRGTVASNRLDCIVAELCNFSRDKSALVITSGKVFVDSAECLNISKRIENGAEITVRGFGKFIIDSVDDVTRKGRYVLLARKRV
ncbi:MAG: hypothetical protein IJF54_04405 [Clostridia bacterium]|nr:hypothetical protein [Clostridia bacterium]